MAFGVKRSELETWKKNVLEGNIDFLTHYWMDERFPGSYTVTKVGCNNIDKLIDWGKQYNLDPKWIHKDEVFPHFDLFGESQLEILQKENRWDHIKRFNLK